MRGLKSPRVLDRAPVLLGSSGNLRDVRQHSVPIGAVQAVETFESIQIPQLIAINCNVISAPRFRYSIHRKANSLINGNKKIEHRKRNDAAVYEWRGKDRKETGMQYVTE